MGKPHFGHFPLDNGDFEKGPNIGTPTTTFRDLRHPVVNAAGQVAFDATRLDDSLSSGIWTNAGGTLAAVARSGSDGPGPGLGPDVIFAGFQGIAFNDAGQAAFHGVTSLTGGSEFAHGVWISGPGGVALTRVAHTSSAGPGPNLGAGVTFGLIGSDVALNSAGEVAFYAWVEGPGIDFSNDEGIWTNAGGTLTAVARAGAAGPGPNLGPGVNFNSLESPLINAAGRVAFVGGIAGPGIVLDANDSGIWTNADGPLSLIARTGVDGAFGPGLGAGVTFGAFLNTFFSPDGEVAFNAAGDMAFLATLAGTGIDASNDWGLWSNIGGTLELIAREGQLFDVDPGPETDVRTIADVDLLGRGSGGEDGRAVALNDNGTLAFRLAFTDGSTGLFTAAASSPGDFDNDGDVDGRDFLLWQRGESPNSQSAGDLADWRANYGVGPLVAESIAVPEPQAVVLYVAEIVVTISRRCNLSPQARVAPGRGPAALSAVYHPFGSENGNFWRISIVP